MKKVYYLLALAVFASNALFAQIIESKRMKEIMGTVTRGSIVVFDLDNTILEAAQTLGSDQWYEHRLKQNQKMGFSLEEALEITSKEWEAVNYNGHVQLVEAYTPDLIESLQDRGIPTLGLTARPHTFTNESLSQLERLGVDFTRNTIGDADLVLHGRDKAIYRAGLLSVGSNNKGKMLLALMQKVGFSPTRVIFIDDKIKNVTNVDHAMNDASIPVFAHRYGAADWKVKHFDAKLADFQWNHFRKFGVVLSDAKAKTLMH